jgi:signal transduction histidine kinase
MRERMTALGGRLDVGRARAGGVRLDAWIPLGDAS